MPVSLSIDGSPMAIESRSSGIEFFAARKSVVALRVDGELRDLATDLATLPEGSVVESVDISSQDGLNILRHSTAHVLAQAVQQVYPDARLGIGPFIEDGFYYDFGNIDAVTPELLRDLEKRMKRIVKEGQTFRRREVSDADAAAELAGQPYKLELVSTKGAGAEGSSVEVGSGGLTMYDNCARDGRVVWTDLCRGPHLPDTRLIGNGFALTKSSAAYWKGDQSGDRLQRIYGTAWASKEDLLAYRERLEEAERRDHRRLGPHLQGGPLPHLRAPPVLCGRHVPAHGRRRPEVLPEGHELPDAQLDLRLARTILPGTAPALLRIRHRLPRREVGSPPGADTRALDHPGRLALLLHARAGRQRDPPPADLRAQAPGGLRTGRLLPGGLHPKRRRQEEGEVHRHRRTVGRRHGRPPGDRRGVRGRARPARRPRPGGRRLLRPEDLRPGEGRDRPHLAARSSASSASSSNTTPGRSPPGSPPSRRASCPWPRPSTTTARASPSG